MSCAKTGGPILTIYMSYDVFPQKNVPFGVSLIMLPIYLPPNPYFGRVNRSFQAKCTKYQSLHIIKTTASIPTKFCRMIKDHQALFVGCCNVHQLNQRCQKAASLQNKLINHRIWHTLSQSCSFACTVMPNGPVLHQPLKNSILKIQVQSIAMSMSIYYMSVCLCLNKLLEISCIRYVNCGRFRCNMLCISGFVDVVVYAYMPIIGQKRCR